MQNWRPTKRKQLFLEDLGLKEAGVNKLIRTAYHLLNLQTYFTAGPKEVRAWTFRKGMKANICGRIQTGSYTNKDGNKVYTTDVLVEEIEFGESKNSNQQSEAPANPSNAVNPMTDENGFMNIPDGIDEELPFA